MEIIRFEHSGYCGGVERAVNMAKEAAKGGTVYTLGRLIHNETAVKELQKSGVIPVESIDALKDGDTAIIRSHGAGREVYEKLKDKGVKIIDATCPSVKAIHKKVEAASAEGKFVLIFGNASHPEVAGIRGWCQNSAVIEDAGGFTFPDGFDNFLAVAQTTLSPEIYDGFKSIIETKAIKNKKTVEFFNSICYTTIVKQNGAKEVAKNADTVLVIGGKDSSNTNALYNISKNICPNTYFISDVSDLKTVANIKNIAKLGIVAGASTPKELIMEVINIMDQQYETDGTQMETVITDEAVTTAEETNDTNEQAPATDAVETAEQAPATDAVETAEQAPATEDAEVKQEEKPKAAKPKEEKMTMEIAMKRYQVRSYREGMKIKSTIVSVDPTGVSVAVEGMGKNDTGFIDKDEMELDGSYNPESYQVGAHIEAIIIPKTDSKMKGLNLSRKACEAIKIEDEAVKKILEGEEFALVCNQAIKGGLLGKLGTYTIFVPASQIRMGYVKNLEDYVGKKLRLRVLPPKEEVEEEGSDAPKRRPNPKRIVASQRVILEEEKAARENAFWEVMQVNNIIKGKVKRFTPFGAFVSIMSFDCLAHISDLSWTKINDPSEVLELNKSYDFVVIKVDRENGKVSLGYKQLQKKPYELAAEKYHVGDVIKGKVERIKDFGAFIEIEPGIDGLVHVSEIGHKWIANANEVLKIGDEIEAKIIGFENNKITLSIKALIDPPVKEEESEEEKPSRSARFSKKFENAEGKERKEKKPRRDKAEDSGEPREWVSASTGATFADLFKDIDINKFDDGADSE